MVEYIIEKIKTKTNKIRNAYYKIYKNGKKIKINKIIYDTKMKKGGWWSPFRNKDKDKDKDKYHEIDETQSKKIIPQKKSMFSSLYKSNLLEYIRNNC